MQVDDHLFPGSVSTIEELRARDLKVGAISNGNSNVEIIESLAPLFDFRVNPSICGHSKRTTHPYDHALKQSKVDLSSYSVCVTFDLKYFTSVSAFEAAACRGTRFALGAYVTMSD